MAQHAQLAAPALAAWNKAALRALAAATPQAVAEAFESALRVLLEFDVVLIAALHRDAPPSAPFYGGGDEPSPAYHDGPYLLDPFYNHFLAGTTEGCFSLNELAPEGFLRSEYFSSYYRHLEIGDELGLLTPLGKGSAAHISITRRRGRSRFTDRDRAWLAATAPLAAEIVRRMNAAQVPSDRSALHDSLRRAWQQFGSSILTEREREVVHLLLRGNSAKAIARALTISPETARNHLKRIYPKLGVASQAELFALFFKSLEQVDPTFEGDPLTRVPR